MLLQPYRLRLKVNLPITRVLGSKLYYTPTDCCFPILFIDNYLFIYLYFFVSLQFKILSKKRWQRRKKLYAIAQSTKQGECGPFIDFMLACGAK